MQIDIENYFNGLCCPPPPPLVYNFDVDSLNWEWYGITDQDSFDTQLGVTTGLFLKTGGNIKAQITSLPEDGIFHLENKIITNVNYITVSGLQHLILSNNQIVTFNPSIALPSSLQALSLDSNQIVVFNPTIALPSSLYSLSLDANQIVVFNPTIALPSSLYSLSLYFNLMTSASYTTMESWANTLHNNPNPLSGTIGFQYNTDSVSGTNLESILTAKGWTVTV